ncbi:MAG: phosphate acyltransferase, partial [Gemmatimonadetes bacterium]|nr:phosphate acyltransferase [Gemmatimonadota bacterium]
MRIVLDAMGGDHAPEYPVTAALAAIETPEEPFEIVLTGDERRISRCLEGRRYPQDRLRIQHAPQVIEMHDAPSTALRRKRDSSIA